MIRSTSVVPVRGRPRTKPERHRHNRITGGETGASLRSDDAIDVSDLRRVVVGDRTAVQSAAGFDVIEGAGVQVEVLAFLGQSEAQHDHRTMADCLRGLRSPCRRDDCARGSGCAGLNAGSGHGCSGGLARRLRRSAPRRLCKRPVMRSIAARLNRYCGTCGPAAHRAAEGDPPLSRGGRAGRRARRARRELRAHAPRGVTQAPAASSA